MNVSSSPFHVVFWGRQVAPICCQLNCLSFDFVFDATCHPGKDKAERGHMKGESSIFLSINWFPDGTWAPSKYTGVYGTPAWSFLITKALSRSVKCQFFEQSPTDQCSRSPCSQVGVLGGTERSKQESIEMEKKGRSTIHKFSSAAHPTNVWSLQIWHQLKGN